MTVTTTAEPAETAGVQALVPTLAAPGTGPAAPVHAFWPVRRFPVVEPVVVDLVGLLTDGSAGPVVVDAPDLELVDLVVGWQQLIGLAVSEQARVVRELAIRNGSRPGALVAELAAALSFTSSAAHALLQRSTELGALPVLDQGLRDGSLDARRVDVLLDELATLTDVAHRADPADAVDDDAGTALDGAAARAACEATRRDVAERVARDAFGLTTTQLRRATRRAVVAADPAATRTRARRAVADRRVVVEPAPDAMAWVTAFLPAADAMVVRTVLDAATDSPDALDERTYDQRRADLFTSIFTTIAATGQLPCGQELPRRRGARPHLQVTVAATTLLGLDETPGELAGYGPLPADVVRRLAHDATWRRLLTDPADGSLLDRGTRAYRPGVVLGEHVTARDVTCTFPGCVRPARSCELDHIAPFRHPRDDEPARGPDAGAGTGADDPDERQTSAANLHAACKRHHDLKTEGHWRVARTPGGGITWTSAAGITYAHHPQPVLVDARAWQHAPPPPPAPPDLGPPPF